jgi:uncharacterized protein YbjT (DUF2867 family)
MSAAGKKLIVFGATGGTGLQFVRQALCSAATPLPQFFDRHKSSLKSTEIPTVLVRLSSCRPHRPLPIRHPNLTVVKGDATDTSQMPELIKGHEAVVSGLGVHGTRTTLLCLSRSLAAAVFDRFLCAFRHVQPHETLHTVDGVDHSGHEQVWTRFLADWRSFIMFLMSRTGVKRVVAITSWNTESQGAPFVVEYLLKPLFLSGFIHDMCAMERQLAATDLNYTIVRPPFLTETPYPQSPDRMVAVEGQSAAHAGASVRMSRADVAAFMLSALDTNQWDRKMVAVGTKK